MFHTFFKAHYDGSIESDSTLSDRLHLLWLKSHSKLHTRLSFNVIREICAYQGTSQRLIIVLEDEYRFFHISNGYCRRIPLQEKIEVDSSTFSTLMTKDRVFVCGGRSGNFACVLEEDGTVDRLPYMNIARGYSGLVYDSATNTAYVFGGLNAESVTRLQSCEKIVLDRPYIWSPPPLYWELMISQMNRARYYFNPCLHDSIVYICGGGSLIMEMYNLKLDNFTLLFDYGQNCNDPCMIVRESDDTLVVMDVNSVFRWSISLSSIVYGQDRPGHCFWSNCTVVLREGVLYGVQGDRCQAIQIQTGAVEEDRRII